MEYRLKQTGAEVQSLLDKIDKLPLPEVQASIEALKQRVTDLETALDEISYVEGPIEEPGYGTLYIGEI